MSPMRAARQAAGLTVRDIRDLTGITLGQLSRFEQGTERLSTDRLLAYARAVGMTGLVRELEPVVKAYRGTGVAA
ncbi:helix-turn-helix domain-containing protein [Streptomyces sp. BH106]|uniref:helix-turn-helix domain-containing protein n=1 Tax=Streptomyces sp. BH106 TaxID=3410409 RepID=UPI003CEB062E